MEIIKDAQNNMLNRREIVVDVLTEGKGTPKAEDIVALIAPKLKSQPSMIHISKIRSSFGTRHVIVDAFVYNSEEDYKLVKRPLKVKKESALKKSTAK